MENDKDEAFLLNIWDREENDDDWGGLVVVCYAMAAVSFLAASGLFWIFS